MEANLISLNDDISKIYRLSDITNRVKKLLLNFSYEKYWIKAHLLIDRGGLKGGHFYCELLDIDQNGNQVAKMRAVIWRPDYQKIAKKLQEPGLGEILKNNGEVCVLCAVRYHDLYGLSLNIFDIDPTFGEAHIDRNRRMILEKLLAEGILRKNTGTSVRIDALRIGLVTSKDSAAYKDFVQTLSPSPYSFKIVLAHSTMQGENTALEVKAAIDALIKAQVDIICIIRGGGSQTDLAWFDSEMIARAVINCPIPVWVGIGHEIDSGVLDQVAHTAFKTPTAVAEALLARIQELDSQLNIAHVRLTEITERISAKHELDLGKCTLQVVSSLKRYLNLLQSRNETRIHRTESRFTSFFTTKERMLAANMHKMRIESFDIIQARGQSIAVNLSRLQSAVINIQKNNVKTLRDAVTRLPSLLQKHLRVKQEHVSRCVDGAQNGFRKHVSLATGGLMNSFLNAKAGFVQVFGEKDNTLYRRSAALAEVCQAKIQLYAAKLVEKHGFFRTSAHLTYARNVAGIDAKAGRLLIVMQVLKRKDEQVTEKLKRIQLDRYISLIKSKEEALGQRMLRLDMLKPENMLKKGYTLTRDKTGIVIRSIRQVDIGLTIVTQYTDGKTESTITGKEEQV